MPPWIRIHGGTLDHKRDVGLPMTGVRTPELSLDRDAGTVAYAVGTATMGSVVGAPVADPPSSSTVTAMMSP